MLLKVIAAKNSDLIGAFYFSMSEIKKWMRTRGWAS